MTSEDRSNRQHFPPPPPFMSAPHQSQPRQQAGPHHPSSVSHVSASSTNPSSAAATSYPQYVGHSSQDKSIAIESDAKISKRPSYTASPYPQYPASYNPSPREYPSHQQQYTSSSSPLGGSSTFHNPTLDTLKSRNVPSYAAAPSHSYLLSSTKANATTAMTTNKPPRHDNHGPIALLLFPPLIFLLLYDMSSSLPLLLFLCVCLIVYALDLANPGDRGGGGGRYRGYYTLCAVWLGWVVLSMVVGYVSVVLDDSNWAGGHVSSVVGADIDESQAGVGIAERGLGGFMGVVLLAAQLVVSIMLLFCLATWSTLQFKWLLHQAPTLARILERILHFTLPPISAAMIAYGLTSSSVASSYVTWGVDSLATIFPYLFAFHLTLGIWLVGAAPSMLGTNEEEEATAFKGKDDKKDQRDKMSTFVCAINPHEGRTLSNLLVFAPMLMHMVTFRQRIVYSYASWDDMFDFILVSTVPYLLHYLLASNGVLDERWRRSLNWFLRAGTSPLEGGRTVRGAAVPMAISLLSCISFQQRYLVSLCAWASYILNGHEGVISSTMATTFLTLGTILMYATVWFFGRQHADGNYLLGEYHEDVFQLLLGASSVFFGMSCSPPWTFLPVPMLLAESVALWVISKQLRYSLLTIFVFFTCATLTIAYRLTFLSETVEVLPNRRIRLKGFAQYAMLACMLLIFFVGLVHRAPGGVLAQFMKKWDTTGICFTIYSLFLVALEFSLLKCPMPVYSRDNFEVGRVAVYSTSASYLTGFLSVIIAWHLSKHKLSKAPCTLFCSSIAIGKVLAVLIEENLLDGDDSLRMIYTRWAVATMLLVALSAPYLLSPVHVKMSLHAKRNFGPSGKQSKELPKNASVTVVLYGAVVLPLVILTSVRLVLEPLVGILIGYGNSAFYVASPKLSEVIGYSLSLWGLAVLQMINHFLPDGGADATRRLSALTFVMGLFISFSAPAIPGTRSYVEDSIFKSVSSVDTVDSSSSGGWGLISAFLAIVLAITGPLELREVRDASGRRDTRQLLRLMIFGTMFGCGLAWFITMQSMTKDIFIPIFVTSFSTMAMSFLGTVATVMAFFLEAKDFHEAEQIANVWAGVGFPVFFVISSVSLSAHAHPFGIGGWASTYLAVCGLLAGAFTVLVRMREEKNSTTRGYGNASCVISWLCAISVVYGRYGVAGVGVVGTTSVAGVPMSVWGTLFCSPILILLEGEPSDGSKKYYQVTSKSTKRGLILPSLTRSNWFVPLMTGTVATFLVATFYAIFLRGCGLSKFSLLFGTGEVIKNQEDLFAHVYGNRRTTGAGPLDDVASLAQKSIVHTQTMIRAARLTSSGIWTSKHVVGPLMHFSALLIILPSLQYLIRHSWAGSPPPASKVTLLLPLNVLAILLGRGIPSLVAAATIALVGGLVQLSSLNK
ncbi:hypothetical protein HJC23_010238 [Cyclotella cryptica]|uniref:Dolichol kinase n=1 Tax=Cyclotella cryptica TaxID=29204 RepID=A0ABD3Q1Z3_9STRA|eukprot:CCRYP_009846-RA/>CCRYP_009846-RA protein AED:0.04 eAED:0.04 QI:174/1/1/1/0.8/0.66/6/1462/1405